MYFPVEFSVEWSVSTAAELVGGQDFVVELHKSPPWTIEASRKVEWQ